MKIKPEQIKEGQVVFFVWEKHIIAKIKCCGYEKEIDSLFINDGAGPIWPASKFNFYADIIEAANELIEYHRQEVVRYEGLIQREIELREFCPDCGTKLRPVRQSANSRLSKEQFGTIRLGDYYCPNCTGETEDSGFKCFWKKDLGIPDRG